jgi:archaemetzincin
MLSAPILIAPINQLPADTVEAVREGLTQQLDCEVSLAEMSPDLDFAYNSRRKQYDSTLLLEQMHSVAPAGQSRIIGITDVDLFIPVLTFVFGEAQLDGRLAVVSAHRLDNRLYGLPEDEHKLRDRLVKECLHELGHTCGLLHCPEFSCVMHGTNTVVEVDLKRRSYSRRFRSALDV